MTLEERARAGIATALDFYRSSREEIGDDFAAEAAIRLAVGLGLGIRDSADDGFACPNGHPLNMLASRRCDDCDALITVTPFAVALALQRKLSALEAEYANLLGHRDRLVAYLRQQGEQ